jgi:DNA-binding MurR/RpiR family transcriptional regulator
MANGVTATSQPFAQLNTPPCLLKVRATLRSLPEHHARIGHFVMQNPAEFLRVDAREIGYICGTSEATVVRFCQRIGYRGLSDIKRVLAHELAANLMPSRRRGKASAGNSVLDHVFADCAEAVRDTLAATHEAKVERIAGAIAGAERLYLFGAGGSAHIAQVAALNFLSLGLQTLSFVDPIQQLAAAKLAGNRDVAVAVTYSGNQSDVAEALRTTRTRGAFCVGITSFEQSLISKWAHELLLMFIPSEKLRGQAGAHRVVQIALLDALAVCVGKLRSKRRLTNIAAKGAGSK